MVCYSLLLKNFPQFIVMHTVKGFGIVNKAEIDVLLELLPGSSPGESREFEAGMALVREKLIYLLT